MSVSPASDSEPRPGVRTYRPRWRTSALTAERMATLLPGVELEASQVAAGPVDLAALFGRTAPVVLEIGSGHGAAALAYAAAHPQVDLLTAEVHVPGVARMLAAAQVAGVANLRVWRGDALDLLTHGLAAQALHGIHLFFPDPWPKKKHAKRRFVQQHTLEVLRDRLADGGVLRIATDHGGYVDHVREQVAEHGGWYLVEGGRPGWRPTDGFEAKGLAAGRTVTDFVLTPR